MLSGLTDRQELLIERLSALADMASARSLPMDVVEIVGFGSFFRGKPRPKDMDLFIRCVARPVRPDFERFAGLLKTIRKEPTYQERFNTPKEAMDFEYRRQNAPRLPGFDDGELERGRFCDWLDGYSWNMMYPDNLWEQVGIDFPEGYTKRMIKRRLPNLNIVEFVSAGDTEPLVGLRSGFRVSLWTTEKRDTVANLTAALAPERIMENTLRDLRSFEVQLPAIKAEIVLLRAEIDLMFRIIRPQSPAQPKWIWHNEWSRDHPELRDAQRLHRNKESVAEEFIKEGWKMPVPTEYFTLTHGKALAMTERLRKEIKGLHETVEMLKEVQASLAFYQSGNARGGYTVHDFVPIDVLSRGNARRRKAKEIFLKELGIKIPNRSPEESPPLPDERA